MYHYKRNLWGQAVLTGFFVFIFSLKVSGQGTYNPYVCVDSIRIVHGAVCNPDYYEPVCGCNGQTYRNVCRAGYAGVQNYQDGICEALDFDFNPNPVSELLLLKAISRQETIFRVLIFDIYGKMYYDKYFYNFITIEEQIDVNNFPFGIYCISIDGNGSRVVKKFVKLNRF